jgi:NAD(P)-dependent dehydrogenase (short-subunit alcohol dehydrogenase family)
MSSPKTVFITGTSSGIGRSTAQVLALKGHTVFATMRSIESKNAGSAETLRNWAVSEGVNLHVIELDVTDNESIERAVQHVIDTTGRIDVLINNAGQGIFGLVESFTAEQWR